MSTDAAMAERVANAYNLLTIELGKRDIQPPPAGDILKVAADVVWMVVFEEAAEKEAE